MSNEKAPPSDAFVFFGATGDLAYKKIFPALQSMVTSRPAATCPIIGVAKSGWNRDQLIERAKASVTEYGGLDAEAFPKLVSQLRYVDGDYNDADHVRADEEAPRQREAPAALPRDPAQHVSRPSSSASHEAGLATDARVVVEKPFGRDLASAQYAERHDPQGVPGRVASSASITTSARRRCRTSSTSASRTRSSSRS